MKKRNLLTAVCALCSVFAMSMFSGCSMLGGLLGGSSAEESSVKAESPASSEEETSSTSEQSEDPESSIPEQSEEPESSTPEQSEDPETSEDLEQPTENALTILTKGEVFPYIDNVKEYLEAGAGAKVSDYYQAVNSQWAPVQIQWKFDATGARKFLVEYATKEDFSDAISEEVGATKRSIDVYNLYKATTYYVRVTALNGKKEALYTANGSFDTTDLGPRFMKVDDVRNVRDLGGYTTADGKRLAQGIAYRGGCLTIPPNNGQMHQISEDGKAYMSEVMGIKTEIDFRTAQESGITLQQGSVIPGASLHYLTINGYGDLFKGWYDEEMQQFFTMLADVNNYPFYIHCTGGADRTGTVICVLHALLGVSDLECLQGYELTSFSSYGLRDAQGNYQNECANFLEKFNAYAGDTMQEKAETWVRSICVTQAQIDSIKAIFYGETEVEGYTHIPSVSVARKAEKKNLNEQYTNLIKTWAVQKKEE
jgi:hypothetical protein